MALLVGYEEAEGVAEFEFDEAADADGDPKFFDVRVGSVAEITEQLLLTG